VVPQISFPCSQQPAVGLVFILSRLDPLYNFPCHFTYSLLTYLLTHSMQQSTSREANQFSASQEIPRILWHPEVYYHIHKCPPPVAMLSQLDKVHTSPPTSHFLKFHLKIVLPSRPGSAKWSAPPLLRTFFFFFFFFSPVRLFFFFN